MKKNPYLFAVIFGCLILTGAGCSNSEEAYQAPKTTRTRTTFQQDPPSIASRRCDAILPLEEASQLTGVSFGRMSSESEDEGDSAYSSVGCKYYAKETKDLAKGMGFSVFTSRGTLLRGSTFSAFHDEKSITLPNLGQDAYYSPDSRGETNPGDSTGLTEILINDRLGIELNSSFDQQTAEKVARAIVVNFMESDYYKELSQRLEAHPAN